MLIRITDKDRKTHQFFDCKRAIKTAESLRMEYDNGVNAIVVIILLQEGDSIFYMVDSGAIFFEEKCILDKPKEDKD